MANTSFRLKVGLRWWLMPYLHTLALLCSLFDREPNWEKLKSTISRAVYVRAPSRLIFQDGIMILGRLSLGWNFHKSRTVKTFGLAFSFASDRVLLCLGPLTIVWFLSDG